MCDYSLHAVATRPAKVGDTLEVTSFNGTMTKGFATKTEPNVAVCLLPGTEIAFAAPVSFIRSLLQEQEITEHRVAVFRKINEDNAHVHHDAVELPDGTHVILSCLTPGQSATVLQLPSLPVHGDQPARVEEEKRHAEEPEHA
jgi:hypothetical protein